MVSLYNKTRGWSQKLRNYVLVVPFVLILPGLAFGEHSTEQRRFAEEDELKLHAKVVVLVTHACTEFDKKAVAKEGCRQLIDYANSKSIPVIHLEQKKPKSDYYCAPKGKNEIVVESEGGRHNLQLCCDRVISVGGYARVCQLATINAVLAQWFRRPDSRLIEIHLYAPGIYGYFRISQIRDWRLADGRIEAVV